MNIFSMWNCWLRFPIFIDWRHVGVNVLCTIIRNYRSILHYCADRNSRTCFWHAKRECLFFLSTIFIRKYSVYISSESNVVETNTTSIVSVSGIIFGERFLKCFSNKIEAPCLELEVPRPELVGCWPPQRRGWRDAFHGSESHQGKNLQDQGEGDRLFREGFLTFFLAYYHWRINLPLCHDILRVVTFEEVVFASVR